MSAATLELSSAPKPLRVLPIPDTEPPPDRPPYLVGRSVQGPLEELQQPTLALALVTTPGNHPAPAPVDNFGPRPTRTADLPDPQSWTRRMVQAVLEVLSGTRPLAQLVRWTSPEVYAGLQRRMRSAAGAQPGDHPGPRTIVRRVRVSQPTDGVIEACAVVISPGRARAVALRLEGLDGRWRMTALEIG